MCVQVKTDIEQKIAQAQSLAVQEALKEANVQNNSKEVSPTSVVLVVMGKSWS